MIPVGGRVDHKDRKLLALNSSPVDKILPLYGVVYIWFSYNSDEVFSLYAPLLFSDSTEYLSG